MKTLIPVAVLAATTLLAPLAAHAQTSQTYNGNGLTGFGGVLGNGSLTVSSTQSSATDGNITFTFNPSGTFNNNDVVLYIDSVAGGLSDTSSLVDNGDPAREAISGYNANNTNVTPNGPTRTQVNFAQGFGADYAISFQNNAAIGVFSVPSPGNNFLNFVTGQTPTNGGPYTVTVTDAQLGLTPGGTFSFVGTLIDPNAAYRSNETLGTSVTTPGTAGDTPNAGFTGTQTFSNSNTFTTDAPAAAPEPSSLIVLGIMGLGLGALMLNARRRTASDAQ